MLFKPNPESGAPIHEFPMSLSPQQSRLQDDIRGLIQGEVRCDEVVRQLFATDAGILERRPLGVVWPRHTDDVVACVRYATEQGIPIHARGAGTETSGASLGDGIVLDFSRFMRRVLRLNAESVLVQPGLIRFRLNTILGKLQRRCFGPDPGFIPAATIGGILSRNGAGAHWLRYGFPEEHLLGLTVVLADGNVLTLKRDNLPKAIVNSGDEKVRRFDRSSDLSTVSQGIALARQIAFGREFPIADGLHQILSPLTIRSNASIYSVTGSVPNRCGYCLQNVLHGSENNEVDLARLIVGSEGTLALITEAHLKTVASPHRAGAVVFGFNSLEQATSAVPLIFPFKPALCELVDRRRLNLLRERDKRFQILIPTQAEAVLLVELNANTVEQPLDSDEVRTRLDQLIETVAVREKLCFNHFRIERAEEFPLFDDFLRNAELALYQMRRSFQTVPLLNDLAVPIETLGNFVVDLQKLLHEHEMTASISGHVGQGHLRIRPILDFSTPGLTSMLHRLTEELCALVWEHRGTINSEHSTGLTLSRLVPKQCANHFPIFRKIKELFDPGNILNPGKVIPDETHWTEFLRRGLFRRGGDVVLERQQPALDNRLPSKAEIGFVEADLPDQLELQLKWDPQQIAGATYRCTGCGACQRLDHAVRTCPLFRRRPEAETSPRAKANLLRGVLEGTLDLKTLTLDSSKAIADHCFHCLLCRTECPAGVDVSHLAARCKAAYVAAHGLSSTDRFLSQLDLLLYWGSLISCPINWTLTNRVSRWLIDKTLGIPQGRKLPALSKISFLGRTQWSKRYALTKSATEPKVALFIDTFGNHFDTKLTELAVNVLEHNGIAVHVPLRQRASGLMSYSVGHADRAERLARLNTLLLGDLIRQGYDVVTLEPASAACIAKDYRCLIDEPDSELVSSQIVDFCGYLMRLHREGRLRLDFHPIRKTVGFHAPCRSIAGGSGRINDATPAQELLGLIPELNVRRVEEGCCGMAGGFGLDKKNYRLSLQIGLALFRKLRSHEIDFGATDCNSCRMQMEHAVTKPTLHPIRLLAFAYGLTPEL